MRFGRAKRALFIRPWCYASCGCVRDNRAPSWYRNPVPELFPRLVSPESRLALIVGDESWTYAELAGAALSHAAAAEGSGVRAGGPSGSLGSPHSQHGCGHPRQHGSGRRHCAPQSETRDSRACAHHERRFSPIGVLRFRLPDSARGGRRRLSSRALRSLRGIASISGGQRQPSPDPLHVRHHRAPERRRHYSR